ncbi:serine/threonine protein kinase [Streptomyces sp. NPDC006430]|uniref:serine/threonine protein kinase n=1 Tax=Streptomyces sp. NPDC006430 TaxID=3154299 RepID=UPI0033AF23B9
MEDYAGRILADRYRLPLPPSDEYELIETRAFDTRSGQEVLVRQVPLPEVVDAELLDGDGHGTLPPPTTGRRPAGEPPAVRRAIAAAQAAASVPDHPRLDQVFDVFAEGGSLWIVSELVPARPLAALIADEPLSPYRAAEVASDVLTALRVLHAHGWTHRNITVRTVLVCDDGRVVLTGLAAGAAEDALCGYDPVPSDSGAGTGTGAPGGGPGWGTPPRGPDSGTAPSVRGLPDEAPAAGPDPDERRADPGSGGYAPLVAPGYDTGPRYTDHITPATATAAATGTAAERPDPKAAARAGAIAAYRAGAQAAAARVTEQRKGGAAPAPEPRPQGSNLPQGYSFPYGGPDAGTGTATPWHGTAPRRQAALPAGTPTGPGPGSEPIAGPDSGPRPGSGSESQSGAEPGSRPEPGAGDAGAHAGAGGAADAGFRSGGGSGAGAESAPGARFDSESGAGYGFPAESGSRPAPGTRTEGAGARAESGVAEFGFRAEPVVRSEAGPVRPALPAPLALPQGYRQAEAPDPTSYLRPGQPGQPTAQLRPDGPERTGGPGGAGPLGAGLSGVPGQQASANPSWSAGWAGGGPRSGLDAERARQTRMAVVGAVTERWSPEQAGPVTGPWQLAAPVGPATDLWALGALLYRAVQGHAPYPEDSVTELVEMVCAEAPAFAEECGPLRPVVESLLRQDPTERPDFEELRGWLRSLVRSAPEPDTGVGIGIGIGVLPALEPDPARLPVVRRRGELHGRHRNPAASRKPRSLGRTLLVGVLALLAGAVAYAMLFMPRSVDPQDTAAKSPVQQSPKPTPTPTPNQQQSGSGGRTPTGTPVSEPAPQTAAPAPPGYTTQQDPEHFEIAVPNGWVRRGMNEAGQVRYSDGEYVLIVVPGRDKVDGNPDPATYQKDKEPELAPYRSSTWASGGDVKSTKVGQQLRVTGRYTWIDGNGRSVVARNFVVALGGSYHVVMVTGPQDGEGKVTEVFEKATGSYKSGG